MTDAIEPLVIGAEHRVQGRFSVSGPVHLLGRVEGTLIVRGPLLIGPGGLVQGEVVAQSVALEAGARVLGTIRSPQVVFAEGVVFRGRLEMGELTEPGGPRPAPPVPPPLRPLAPIPPPGALPGSDDLARQMVKFRSSPEGHPLYEEGR